MNAIACEVQNSWAVLMGLCLLASTIVLAWPWLQKFQQFKVPLLFGVVFAGVFMLGGDTLLAIPNPNPADHPVCQLGNSQQWPCWVLEALWCPCTWPNEMPPLPW